jgi:biopolymer transport protein ExbD
VKIETRTVSSGISALPMVHLACLVFFFLFTAAVFSKSGGLVLDLGASRETPPDLADAVFVQIGADGGFTVDCRPIAPDRVRSYLQARLARQPAIPAVLYTDGSASYDDLVGVYDLVRSAMGSVVVVTRHDVERAIARHGRNPFEARCLGLAESATPDPSH